MLADEILATANPGAAAVDTSQQLAAIRDRGTLASGTARGGSCARSGKPILRTIDRRTTF